MVVICFLRHLACCPSHWRQHVPACAHRCQHVRACAGSAVKRTATHSRNRPRLDEARDILASMILCHVPVERYNFDAKASTVQTASCKCMMHRFLVVLHWVYCACCWALAAAYAAATQIILCRGYAMESRLRHCCLKQAALSTAQLGSIYPHIHASCITLRWHVRLSGSWCRSQSEMPLMSKLVVKC